MSKTNNVNPPVTSGQIYNLTIDDLGTHGEGIGKIDGFTVFAPGALPGEEIEWQALTVKKNYAVGKCRKVITSSSNRSEPRCPLFPACGGCQLQHLSYAAELEWKERNVREILRRLGGVESPPVRPIKGATSPWHYRNKMQFPVGRSKGKPAIGCYAAGSHSVVSTENCLIQVPGNNKILRVAHKIIRQFAVPIYDERTGRGLLRHIVGRVGADGELMLVLVTAGFNLPHAKEIIRAFREKLPPLVSLQQNIQPAPDNVIMGEETVLLWGRPAIYDNIGDFSFAVSPRSFFQVNTAQAKILYDTVADFAALTGQETVLDAYSGTGTIGLYLAKKAKKIIGVEIVPDAVKDARQNAERNHINNAEFIVGDATDVLPDFAAKKILPDVVILDPPRSGLAQAVVDTVLRFAPSRLVYVSCNAATLARDTSLFCAQGYTLKAAQPVDMFPRTTGIETVALFVR